MNNALEDRGGYSIHETDNGFVVYEGSKPISRAFKDKPDAEFFLSSKSRDSLHNSLHVEESKTRPGKWVINGPESELPSEMRYQVFDSCEQATLAMQGLDKKEKTPPIDVSNSRAFNKTREYRRERGNALFGKKKEVHNASGEAIEGEKWKCNKCGYDWLHKSYDEVNDCPHCGSKDIDFDHIQN